MDLGKIINQVQTDENGNAMPHQMAKALGMNLMAFLAWGRQNGFFVQERTGKGGRRHLPAPDEVTAGHLVTEIRTKADETEYTQVLITPQGIQAMAYHYWVDEENQKVIDSAEESDIHQPAQAQALRIQFADGNTAYGFSMLPIFGAEALGPCAVDMLTFAIIDDEGTHIEAFSKSYVQSVYAVAGVQDLGGGRYLVPDRVHRCTTTAQDGTDACGA